jgi:peptidoglycan-associated lipoprotein
MLKQLGLAVLFVVAGVWLAGCATGSSTAPVADQTTPVAPTPSSSDKQAAPAPSAPAASDIGGTAPDAGLLAKRRVYFAFDSSQLDDANRKIVEAHARNLASNPALKVQLEGHCDERGTREYNLALGERRAQAVERVMRVLNVSGGRVATTSFGEEKPVAPGHDEAAWAQNRRVEIVYR